MNREDVKDGDLVLWCPPEWKFNPMLRRVTEAREDCAYIKNGVPIKAAKLVPYEHLSPVPTDYKYTKYPIQRQ